MKPNPDFLSPSADTARRRFFWITISVLVGFVMLAGKWAAYWVTGSSAILSDALESVVHIAATCFALYSLTLAARPRNLNYPYGYGRIEFFSAGFEGGLVAVAGVAIVYQAVLGFVRREPLRQLDLGLTLITIASAINFLLGWTLVRRGRETRSLILEADGHHVLSDAYTSVGVIVGVAVVRIAPALWWVDPLVALAVGFNVLRTGVKLGATAYGGLMGRADWARLGRVVAALQTGRQPGWLDVHQLRSWQAGDVTFVDFHLVVPADWTVAQLHDAHVLARDLIRGTLEGPVESIVHFDPDRPDRPVDSEAPWSVESATRLSQSVDQPDQTADTDVLAG